MKRLLLICTAALSLLVHAPAHAERQVADRIVAVVNRSVITQSQLDTRVRMVLANLKRQNVTAPPDDILQKQVLDRLIAERIQVEVAAHNGLRVDDNQLERTISRIAEQNRMTREQLFEAIQEQGLTPQTFRDQIRQEIITSRLRDREVDSRVTVSDAEVDAFLEAHKGSTNNEYNVSHILIQVPEDAAPADVEAKQKLAEEALAALRSGASFSATAAKYSAAKDALDGGSLGWRTGARLPDLFLKTLQGMKKGQVSGVLRSANGFHIIQLVDLRGASAPVEQTRTRARHILVRISDTVTEADARLRIDQVHDRLKQGAKFDDIARVYSEDPSSVKGGDLGWLNPGDTVPDFETAMDALKPGEISEPVKSQFGWHIIQVLERKTEDVGPERARAQARNELRQRRSDELYEEWLREQRDASYVDIRL